MAAPATASAAPLVGRRLTLSLRDGPGGARLTPAVLDRALALLDDACPGDLLMIEGDGTTFCDGMDLALLDRLPPGADPGEAPARYGRLLAAIERAPCPVIALVEGDARGGGVGVAAAADLVVASPRATFSLPEALVGLVPAMVFPPLARRVGAARARLLALGAAPMDAEEARRAGLVDEVAADPRAAAERHARRFARMDARALAAVKRLVAAHYAPPPGWAADATAAFAELAASAETRARLARLLAGDAPWEGA